MPNRRATAAEATAGQKEAKAGIPPDRPVAVCQAAKYDVGMIGS
jgi:hypothetical protein